LDDPGVSPEAGVQLIKARHYVSLLRANLENIRDLLASEPEATAFAGKPWPHVAGFLKSSCRSLEHHAGAVDCSFESFARRDVWNSARLQVQDLAPAIKRIADRLHALARASHASVE